MAGKCFIPYLPEQGFSNLILDYQNEIDFLKESISVFPSKGSVLQHARDRIFTRDKRDILVEVLKEQYAIAGIDVSDRIDKLLSENCLTVCAAHQPNIFTGYLYTIYKIIHSINLAKELSASGKKIFLPVFFIGSEDHDIEEIGTFYLKGKEYKWTPEEKGACGRFSTESLIPVRDHLLGGLKDEKLKELLIRSYDGKRTLSQATRYFLHHLFEKEELIILDADHAKLKALFSDIMQDELNNRRSFDLVSKQVDRLRSQYKIQVEPREINLFYLDDGERTRIDDFFLERNKGKKIPDKNLSPNVVLRPLFQETILPNVAFIGGGGEIAYWLELKSLFAFYDTPFPVLFLRNSISIVHQKVFRKMEKVGFGRSFMKKDHLLKENALQNEQYKNARKILMESFHDYDALKNLSEDIRRDLAVSFEAHRKKIENIHHRILEKIRTLLKRNAVQLNADIEKIHAEIYPDGRLQERYQNIIEMIDEFGWGVLDQLKEFQEPFSKEYLILGL